MDAFQQRRFPNERDAGVGIRLAALPAVPHRSLFGISHIIPLFGANKFSIGIEEEPAFIDNRLRHLAAKRDIGTRHEVREQGLDENRFFQKRFIAEGNADAFRVGFLNFGERGLQRAAGAVHFGLDA